MATYHTIQDNAPNNWNTFSPFLFLTFFPQKLSMVFWKTPSGKTSQRPFFSPWSSNKQERDRRLRQYWQLGLILETPPPIPSYSDKLHASAVEKIKFDLPKIKLGEDAELASINSGQSFTTLTIIGRNNKEIRSAD